MKWHEMRPSVISSLLDGVEPRPRVSYLHWLLLALYPVCFVLGVVVTVMAR